MRSASLFFVLFLLLTSACKESKNLKISFCDSLDSLNNCVGESTNFPRSKRVYLRFDSKTPFETNTLTGYLYAIDGKNKIYLNSKEFNLNKGDRYVTYFLPFERFNTTGEYQVEFIDAKGSVLDSARVKID